MLIFTLLLLLNNADGPVISLDRTADSQSVLKISGLNRKQLQSFIQSKPPLETWQQIVRIVVATEADAKSDSLPCVLGSFRAEQDCVIFTPRFPFAPDTPYRITVNLSKLTGDQNDRSVSKTVVIPKPDAPPAKITAIYPSGDAWPENSLRLYVHFSSPMSQGNVYEHIRLRRADGTIVSKPFIEIDEELWNPDGTRFTLLFDPGRIKNGLASKAEAGPNLEKGKTYTLEISKDWKDANGRTQSESFRKSFAVTTFDAVVIDPANWKLELPKSGTRSPLNLNFPKPLDHALIQRMIHVHDDRGKRIEGTITVLKNETSWAFTPRQAWSVGAYELVVDTRLEDSCGNRVGSPFELDVFRSPTRRLEAEFVKRRFEIK